MPSYTATQRYRSGRGQFEAGDQVDVSDEYADLVNLDAPGTLAPTEAEPAEGDGEDSGEPAKEDGKTEERQLDQPPADRMVTGARRRDRMGDPGDQGPITRDDHKAVRDKVE